MRRLVILGAGYGGFTVLHKLLDEKLPDDVQITVVERNPYHSLKTEFYSIAAGTRADKEVREDLPTDKRVNYIFGEVEKIDIENRQLRLADSEGGVGYDYLVIGLGCEDNYHGVKGAPEFTYSVQSISRARHTGLAVGDLQAYGKVAIVGAGLSGIEVASEIRESRPDLNITLLDRGQSVLPAFDKKIQKYVEGWFKENDVEVLHGANVEYVVEEAVCNNGLYLENDVTIWTAGVKPHHLIHDLPFTKNKQGQVVLNNFYQVPSHSNIYVVGDGAASAYSPSAQLAEEQGEGIAEVLTAVLKREEPKVPKEVKLKGSLGSLGKADGFGNMFKTPLTGLLPRLAKSGVLWLSKRH